MSNEVFCPNCGRRAAREGNKLICEFCDAEFSVNKTEKKVVAEGKIASIEKRVYALEQRFAGRMNPDTEKPEPTKESNDEAI